MKRNVRLVYQNRYKYDTDNKTVYITDDYDYIELGKIEVDNYENYARINASNHRANQLLKTIGINNIQLPL